MQAKLLEAIMPGLIVFGTNYLDHQGESQVADKSISADMTFDLENLTEVLIDAGKVDDKRIGVAVGLAPAVVNIGGPFKNCEMIQSGIAILPAKPPKNEGYWNAKEEAEKAKKQCGAKYLEVKEGMHISKSFPEPHMTVLVYSSDGKQEGQNIHVAAKADGKKWKFTRVHP